MVDDGVAAAVQERSVQQRHGHGPQHYEDHRQSNDRPVLAVARAFDIERGRQVGLEVLARDIVEAKGLALEGEEEGARHGGQHAKRDEDGRLKTSQHRGSETALAHRRMCQERGSHRNHQHHRPQPVEGQERRQTAHARPRGEDEAANVKAQHLEPGQPVAELAGQGEACVGGGRISGRPVTGAGRVCDAP